MDIGGRENLKQLVEDLDVKETYISADFTADYSPYEIEPDALITEETQSAVFYQTIFEMINEQTELIKKLCRILLKICYKTLQIHIYS